MKHFNRNDVVVWIDSDLILTDASKTDVIGEILADKAGFDFIIADQSDNLNTGIFIVRRTPWVHQFLDTVWRTGLHYRHDILFCDQGVIYLIMLNYIADTFANRTSGGYRYDNECAPERKPAKAIHYCTNDVLARYGFTYNNRDNVGKICILPQNQAKYRINQWYFGPGVRPYSNWNDADYYREGDLGVHTKLPLDLLKNGSLVTGVQR
ncbi:hypothetical protein HXX76_010909 [Chlamydomonas incerta]|uniref:Uncharacterized protein n=1 Tax=Chlamydomonas incerta TaxID=51695 RepID=A0A835SV68_CHLIN|nr:hypothetical protein HXX76_010909 [Chlamydomonas incerta]|eukprot:KAG2427190.1 hypothetical protein HXX76_010909 [Chlamydomonas incerta]